MFSKLNKEDTILRFSLRFLGILTFLGTIMFFMLSKAQDIHLPSYVSYLIIAFGLITAGISHFSVRHSSFRFTALLLVSLFIAIIGTFQQMNISLLFIIPIFLSYCFQSKKKAYLCIYLNLFFFNFSKIFKSYNIYIVNPAVYEFKKILLSNLIIGLFETIIFLTVAMPIFMLLIKQNNELKKSLKEREDATNDILQFCSTATSFHNKYLSIHIKGVRDITKILLDALIEGGVYIAPEYYDQIVFSVQFHDIGKIYIDSSILDKKGRLTPDEFTLIKEHPDRGVELFSLLPKNVLDEDYMRTCKNVIYQHHERLDGSGYPTGTKKISFEAKIVAIADVIDALLSWRPYKPPLSWDNLVSILEKEKAGFNYECLKVVYKEKDKILAVSDENNKALKQLLGLSGEDIIRQ